MPSWIADPELWASLATLTVLEVVLGIDNLIFLSIATQRLPEARQELARAIGLALALVARLAFLAGMVWLAELTRPLFTAFGEEISWRDIVLIVGGLYLIGNGTREIHHAVEGGIEAAGKAGAGSAGFGLVILQIVAIDVVFSLDSVITAIGMARDYWVMATAVVIAIAVMLFASRPVSGFVARHPTVKMLALSFLLLIGVALVADGLDVHIPKGYLYFAVAFSILVEGLNLAAARRRRAKTEGRA